MAQRWRVKKGDTVIVTTGKDKGKTGEILKVLRDDNRVIVKGVNMVKRHAKPSPTNPNGVIHKELSLHVSNIMHVDPETGKATRVGMKILEDGRKVRYAKVSGKLIDK